LKSKTLKILLLGAFVSATLLSLGGEISDYHFKNARPKLDDEQKSRSNGEVASTNHGITEIGIERSGCYGRCPVYTFIVRSDGTFRYTGTKYVEHEGEFIGTIPVWYFHRLAQFVRDSGYMELEDRYSRMVTDSSTTYTTVMMGAKRKTISNYANSGPTKLWAIEQLIDDLMAKEEWKTGLRKAPPKGLPKPPPLVLPKSTQYDNEPILRAVYLDLFRKGYVDGWERNESLPVFGPTNVSDKARVLGYADGAVVGRAARNKWFGTNSQQIGSTNAVPPEK
jgi:hypothetical protein